MRIFFHMYASRARFFAFWPFPDRELVRLSARIRFTATQTHHVHYKATYKVSLLPLSYGRAL